MNVKDILGQRDRKVVTVGPKTPIAEAARAMTEHRIGALVVEDNDGVVVGILSERDVMTAVGNIGPVLSDVTTDELMTGKVITCRLEDTVIQIILKFDALGIRHLVAMDDGKLVGVVSMRDVLEAFSRMILERKIFGQHQFATEFAEALAGA